MACTIGRTSDSARHRAARPSRSHSPKVDFMGFRFRHPAVSRFVDEPTHGSRGFADAADVHRTRALFQTTQQAWGCIDNCPDVDSRRSYALPLTFRQGKRPAHHQGQVDKTVSIRTSQDTLDCIPSQPQRRRVGDAGRRGLCGRGQRGRPARPSVRPGASGSGR